VIGAPLAAVRHSGRRSTASRLVLLLSSLLTLGFLVFAARPWQQAFTEWVLLPGFALWALSPYGGLARLVQRVEGRRYPTRVVLACSVLLGGSAAVPLYLAFVVHPVPQNGLLFVFLPLYQWFAVGVLFLLTWWWRRGIPPDLTGA
jgi:hypothetical protein